MRPRRLRVTAAEHTNWPRRLSRLLAAVLVALSAPSAATAAIVVQTTQNLHEALTIQPPQRFAARPAPGSAVIRVDSSIRYQRITGFGGAMTDSSAWLLYDKLAPVWRGPTFDALFGTSGLGLNFVRIPIAASDFTLSTTPYSYDDQPSGQSDPTLSGFSIAHDEAYIIPALKEVLAVDPGVFTLASPWTAPPWMKANDSYDDWGLGGSVLPRYYAALAQYFVKFIQGYQAQGVAIDAITPMNEPSCSCKWPGSALSSADDATFLPQDLAPALGAAGLHPAIFGVDDTELTDAQALLSGPAAPTLGGIAFHCYKGMGQMSALHAEYPSEDIILDECSPGIIPYATAEVAIDATRNWASAVQLWNLALDPSGGPFGSELGCPGCTGIVTVNERTGTPSLGLNYFQYGQTTKYVKPGAVRIFSTRLVSDGYGVTRGVDDVAFVNPDGSKVLVAYNNRGRAAKLAIEWRGRFLNWVLPAHATVTLIWH